MSIMSLLKRLGTGCNLTSTKRRRKRMREKIRALVVTYGEIRKGKRYTERERDRLKLIYAYTMVN